MGTFTAVDVGHGRFVPADGRGWRGSVGGDAVRRSDCLRGGSRDGRHDRSSTTADCTAWPPRRPVLRDVFRASGSVRSGLSGQRELGAVRVPARGPGGTGGRRRAGAGDASRRSLPRSLAGKVVVGWAAPDYLEHACGRVRGALPRSSTPCWPSSPCSRPQLSIPSPVVAATAGRSRQGTLSPVRSLAHLAAHCGRRPVPGVRHQPGDPRRSHHTLPPPPLGLDWRPLPGRPARSRPRRRVCAAAALARLPSTRLPAATFDREGSQVPRGGAPVITSLAPVRLCHDSFAEGGLRTGVSHRRAQSNSPTDPSKQLRKENPCFG